MVFRININTYGVSIYSVKAWVRRKFRTNLFTFRTGINEIALNRYCVQHYKKTLKALCLWLFDNSNVKVDTDNNIVVLFENRKLDDIAKLITYGNGKLQGSQIFAWSLGRIN